MDFEASMRFETPPADDVDDDGDEFMTFLGTLLTEQEKPELSRVHDLQVCLDDAVAAGVSEAIARAAEHLELTMFTIRHQVRKASLQAMHNMWSGVDDRR
ncbi:hypothetical protein ACFL59_10225 [Planctomycetota bacterium]